MSRFCYDVIIIGGGLAGLSAALELTTMSRKVCIVEARDRLGGRIFTSKTDDGHLFEWGATWIGPTQKNIMRLVDRYQLELNEQVENGISIQFFNGQENQFLHIPEYGLFIEQLETQMKFLENIAATIDPKNPFKTPNAVFLDSLDILTFTKLYFPTMDEKIFIEDLETIFSVHPSKMSALYTLWFFAANDNYSSLIKAQKYTFKKGTMSLVDSMHKEAVSTGNLELYFNSPATAVVQDEDGVTVDVSENGIKKSFRAKYCICTVPPNLIDRIDFYPPLPTEIGNVKKNLNMGTTTKVFVRYQNPFWKKDNFSGQSASDLYPMFETYDYSNYDNQFYTMLVFINEELPKLYKDSVDYFKNEICKRLQILFKSEEALSPIDFWYKDWSDEEYTKGAFFCSSPPGNWTQYGYNYFKDYDRVLFAGTEQATMFVGYMDGAIQSGTTQAKRIIQLIEEKKRRKRQKL